MKHVFASSRYIIKLFCFSADQNRYSGLQPRKLNSQKHLSSTRTDNLSEKFAINICAVRPALRKARSEAESMNHDHSYEDYP